MLKLRPLIAIVVFMVSLIFSIVPISLPAHAAEGDDYRYIKKGIYFLLEDLVGGNQDRLDEILANFNDGEQDNLVYSAGTTLIGMNCDNSDDPQAGGPTCEQYFYPRQERDGGVFNGNPAEYRIFTNIEALADTGAYEDGSIHVPVDDVLTGTVIPLIGPTYEITIDDPDNFAPDVIDLCQGDNPSPDCDRFTDEPPAITDEVEPTCSEKFPAVVGWAICAVLDWTDRSINKLLVTLNNMLSINPSEVNTAEMRKAWSFFRNIASLLLVVIGLIMIIGQAVSKE